MFTEGATKLWVVNSETGSHNLAGPGSAHIPVFFNHAMEFNRDVSIVVLEQFLKENKLRSGSKIEILDGLAGTGARGVRFGNEVMGVKDNNVTIKINDHNPVAYKIILKNIEVNNLTNAVALKKDLNELLAKNRYDYIDIDPFGSPIKFLDASARMVKHNGILAVTATDTATLFGSYPKTCVRRYDAFSCKTTFSHELGVRLLLGYCIRVAARYNLGLIPILVHSTDHYYRVYLKVQKGRGEADKCLTHLGYLLQRKGSYQFKFISRKGWFFEGYCGYSNNKDFNDLRNFKVAGPLWLGPMYKPEFVKCLSIGNHKFDTNKQLTKMLGLFHEEANAPPGFYEANALASELKLSTPPLSKILDSLIEKGNIATRTHFHPNAFKTDAGYDEVVLVMREIC